MSNFNLKGRIPVEQLDDERLTNIERKLVVSVSEMRAPADRASRRLFAGLAMAVAVAGVVGYKLRGTEAPASMSDEPQRLAINTDKTNTVTLGDTTLTAGAGTDLVVERTQQRVVIEMRRGSLDLLVAHDPSRLLVVRAGDTEIEDVGTHFVVDYDGASQVAVRVTEGEVKVKRGGKDFAVTAMNAWMTYAPRPSRVSMRLRSSTALSSCAVPSVASRSSSALTIPWTKMRASQQARSAPTMIAATGRISLPGGVVKNSIGLL